jgi:hypothetical protein
MISPLEQRAYITFRMHLTGVEARTNSGLVHVIAAAADVAMATWHRYSVERKVTEFQKEIVAFECLLV